VLHTGGDPRKKGEKGQKRGRELRRLPLPPTVGMAQSVKMRRHLSTWESGNSGYFSVSFYTEVPISALPVVYRDELLESEL